MKHKKLKILRLLTDNKQKDRMTLLTDSTLLEPIQNWKTKKDNRVSYGIRLYIVDMALIDRRLMN